MHQLKQYRKTDNFDIVGAIVMNLFNQVENPLKALQRYDFKEVVTVKIKDGMCLSVLGQAVYDEVRGVTTIQRL